MAYISVGKYHFNLEQISYFTDEDLTEEGKVLTIFFVNPHLDPVMLYGEDREVFLSLYDDLPKPLYN